MCQTQPWEEEDRGLKQGQKPAQEEDGMDVQKEEARA
jgi:hypothetical protein